MSLDYQLFLGFPIDAAYQALLDKIPDQIRHQFIQNNPDYLQQIYYNQCPYIGKSLGTIIEFPKIELIEANIYSLLRRLVEHYPYEKNPLILLAIPYA